MANPTSILKRVNRAFRKFNPPAQYAYKRLNTRTGGDPLIGRSVSVNKTDTLLDPQPIYTRPTREEVGMYKIHTLLAGTSVEPAADWVLTVTATAMSLAELQNKDMQIVFKNADGSGEEVFNILDFDSTGFKATDMLYDMKLRSVKR
jgi:hypothetical protein